VGAFGAEARKKTAALDFWSSRGSRLFLFDRQAIRSVGFRSNSPFVKKSGYLAQFFQNHPGNRLDLVSGMVDKVILKISYLINFLCINIGQLSEG